MVADDALNVKYMLEGEIHYRNKYDMEADNDQCTDGYINNHHRMNIIECFAEIKHSEHKTDINRIEESDVQ